MNIPSPDHLIGAATRDSVIREGMREANEWQRKAATRDSFQNFAARLGIGTDNLSSMSTYGFNPISRVRTLLEWMYRGSWIVGKAVDCVAEDMTKAGVSWLGSQTPEDQDKINQAIRRTHMWPRLQQGHKWGRLYGGAIVVMMIDGQKTEEPLDVERIRSGQFKGFVVLDRWMINPTFTNLVSDPASVDQGLPEYYDVVMYAPPAVIGRRIHHSRCFRMIGIDQPYWQLVWENYWGISVLERLYDRLVAFDSATQGAAQLIYRAYLRTLKIKDLRKVVAAGGPAYEGLIKQIEAMRMFQSNEGISTIDAEDEMQVDQYTFAGIGDTLLQFGQQLAGAIDTPLVRLFGQSPAGLNSTGESDMRIYYDGILQRQENDLRPKLEVAIRLLARSEGVKLKDDFGFHFKPLWQLTDAQKSEIAQRNTQTILAVQETGILAERGILRELKQQSETTGIWTNITDADIAAASDQVAPPMPAMPGLEPGNQDPRPGYLPKPREERGPQGAAERKDTQDATRDAGDEYPGIVNNQYDVISGAVSNRAGGTTYVDASIPEWSELPNGWACHNWKYLAIHEQTERRAMADGASYPTAHEHYATPAERASVENDGGDWREYTQHMNGLLSHIEAKSKQRTLHAPPDPHIRPGVAIRRYRDGGLPLIEVCGIPVVIENRRGERRAGPGWSVIMPADYGYIRDTGSAEGVVDGVSGLREQMDCFVGPDRGSDQAWVIDASNPGTGQFDEHKVLLGFTDQAEALAHFRAAYDHGGRGRIMGCTRMSIDQLRQWLATGDPRYPVSIPREALTS